jgi:PBP1b-binding outer membrane lipoprotein LpoB
MRPITLVGATLLLAVLLTGCIGPATGATPEPTGPAPAGPTSEPDDAAPTNPIAGPSNGAGKPSSSFEVPPPAY